MGERYDFDGVKDAKLSEKLFNTYGYDGLKDKIDMFFTIKDDFVTKAGYTWGILWTKRNSLVKPKSRRADVPRI